MTSLEKKGFMPDLIRWGENYISHIKRQYSPNTYELYDRAVQKFIEYSKTIEDEMDSLKDIRSSTIEKYIDFLEELAKNRGQKKKRDGKYLSNSTKDVYLKAIKGLFTYISDNNDELYTFDRYFKKIKKMDKTSNEEKLKHLSDSEVDNLVKELRVEMKKSNYNYASYRNSLLVKLMLFGGLRISEALGVRLDDIRADDETGMYIITVFGKGQKEQNAFVSKKMIEDEIDYFANETELKGDELIMKTRTNSALHRRNAFEIVAGIYKRANINKKGLHILRHTLAMRLTKKGVNPLIIKKVLRHKNIATTTIYAKAQKDSVAESLKVVDSNE